MKLVRDQVPAIMAAAGQACAWHVADPAEYAVRLRVKLLEEAHEAVAATSPAELLEELGDVLQVLYTLASEAGYHAAEVECARARKTAVCGGFTGGIVWHDPTQPAAPTQSRTDGRPGPGSGPAGHQQRGPGSRRQASTGPARQQSEGSR